MSFNKGFVHPTEFFGEDDGAPDVYWDDWETFLNGEKLDPFDSWDSFHSRHSTWKLSHKNGGALRLVACNVLLAQDQPWMDGETYDPRSWVTALRHPWLSVGNYRLAGKPQSAMSKPNVVAPLAHQTHLID